MKIHREGRVILLSAPIILFSIYYLFHKITGMGQRGTLSFVTASTILYLWLAYFFRNPDRKIFYQESAVLVPADGKIVAIEKVYEGEYLREGQYKVSIFMSPFNVHVNRAPISGKIAFFKYHPGKYLIAFHPKSSLKNERTTVVIENEQGIKILFRQIAGILARRIKFYPKEGEFVQQGHECGFIKFGSRADIYLPLNATIHVQMGQKVKGGISVLATLSSSVNAID